MSIAMTLEGDGMRDETHRTSSRIWVNCGRNMAIDKSNIVARTLSVTRLTKKTIASICCRYYLFLFKTEEDM
jgi:hypothetical protein